MPVQKEPVESAGPPPAPARSPHSLWPDLRGVHAFVIEDNADTRIMVEETLQHCGAVVTAFQSADAAIGHLAECLPTIFICDLAMPGLDGLQFMRRIRTQAPERGGSVPAIAITAYYEDFVSAAALEAGFNAYMMKPIRLETLCGLVKQLTTGPS